jgi:hypothetical protein
MVLVGGVYFRARSVFSSAMRAVATDSKSLSGPGFSNIREISSIVSVCCDISEVRLSTVGAGLEGGRAAGFGAAAPAALGFWVIVAIMMMGRGYFNGAVAQGASVIGEYEVAGDFGVEEHAARNAPQSTATINNFKVVIMGSSLGLFQLSAFSFQLFFTSGQPGQRCHKLVVRFLGQRKDRFPIGGRRVSFREKQLDLPGDIGPVTH